MTGNIDRLHVTEPQTFQCPDCQQRWQRPPLTRRQVEVLRFIRDVRAESGYSPTQDEIAAQFGFESLSTVHEHLTNLERKGYISRFYNEPRAILLIEPVP